MENFKKWIKELKRVRWPSFKEANKSFITTIIFIFIASIILFGLALGMNALWQSWGVGVNG